MHNAPPKNAFYVLVHPLGTRVSNILAPPLRRPNDPTLQDLKFFVGFTTPYVQGLNTLKNISVPGNPTKINLQCRSTQLGNLDYGGVHMSPPCEIDYLLQPPLH